MKLVICANIEEYKSFCRYKEISITNKEYRFIDSRDKVFGFSMDTEIILFGNYEKNTAYEYILSRFHNIYNFYI